MGRSYKDRIVAFVDMLGTSERVLADSEGTFTNAVYKVISALNGRKRIWQNIPHIRTGKSVEVEFDAPDSGEERLTTVSDGIVMSFPAIETRNPHAMGSRSLPILRCLDQVFSMQLGLLSVGLRTRGGICRGRLVHTNNFVYGEGIVKAYRLESRVAIYPRTVIDQEIIDTLISEPIPSEIVLFENRIAHMIRVDGDGHHFVDFLGQDPMHGKAYLSSSLPDIYKETMDDLARTTDPKIITKLQWLKNYILKTAADMDQSRLLHVNLGTAFGEKFRRTQDTLKSYVDSLEKERKAPESPT